MPAFYTDHNGPASVQRVAEALNEAPEETHLALLLGPDGLHVLRSDRAGSDELEQSRTFVRHLLDNWDSILNQADGLPSND